VQILWVNTFSVVMQTLFATAALDLAARGAFSFSASSFTVWRKSKKAVIHNA